MAILTISKLLNEAGLDISKRIKLVRHKDSRKEQLIEGKPFLGNPYEWYVKDRQTFINYQAEQSEDRFKGVDYIVSFIGEEGTTARMVGVYCVLGLDEEKMKRINNGRFFYKMEEIKGFNELNAGRAPPWFLSITTDLSWAL